MEAHDNTEYKLRNDRKKVKKHQAFKETLGTFFLDILQRFVFAKDAAQERGIDREVLESLLSFVVTKELPKDDDRYVGNAES